MAGTVMHLVIADKLLERLAIKNPALFYCGNLAPDAIMSRRDYIREMKNHTHFKDGQKSYTFRIKENRDIYYERLDAFAKRFLDKSDPYYELYLGYIVHILTDELYLLEYYEDFIFELESAGMSPADEIFSRKFVSDVYRVDRELVSTYGFTYPMPDILLTQSGYDIPGWIDKEEIEISKRYIIDRNFRQPYEKEELEVTTYEKNYRFIELCVEKIPEMLEERFRPAAGKNIKAVFIDIDDTVFSFEEFVKQTMREGFEESGLRKYREEDYTVFKRINSIFWNEIEQGKLTLKELRKIRWQRIFKELQIDYDGEKFEEYFVRKLWTSTIYEPGAREMLDYLKGRYILCAASNGPYEQQINRLRLAGLDRVFDRVFVSSEIGAEKPEFAFFEYCFNEINEGLETCIKPEESMIIGDSLTSDMMGGKNYGMRTCLYTRGGRVHFETSPADFIVDSLEEIRKIL